MEVLRCPICGGTGQVDSGFYTQTSGQWTSSGGTETCRSCWGKGYILVPDEHFEHIEEAFKKNVDGLSEKVAGHLRRYDYFVPKTTG